MSVRRVWGAGVIVAVAMASPGAWAADASQAFIMKAIQGNLAEVSMGQLAQQKGASDAVRRFGQTLVTDHGNANQDATSVARTMGVVAPMEPTAEQKKSHDDLAAKSGADFDRDFASAMVMDHKKDISDYEAEANGPKDAASDYAAKTLPTLRNHLATAQSLAEASGNGMTASTSNGEKAPLAGANSFTEGQAKSRIEGAGFSGVSALKKDDQGIWRGTATKNGASMGVALDYKGNVVGQ